ncbi:phage portal protein [Streptococcus suis]|uniref:phage portal protein n=1 Tax=Streptococcus suis TaxID=1307 RepID=UPI0028746F7F|nr:phage portal protein [Streptococcus suis]MDS1161628.1 phage portal protein [Streptococcus suis]
MAYKETLVDSTGKSKTLELRFHREARLRYQAESVEDLLADNYKLLKTILEHHQNIQRPRIQELLDYAEGNNHEVSKSGRRREEDMADVRAIHNFGKAIATFKQGYLVGKPIQVEYNSGNEESDKVVQTALDELENKAGLHQLNRTLVLDLSKTGRAYELTYRATDDVTKSVKLDPLSTFVIYDTTTEKHSVAGVRYYNQNQFDDSKKTVEVYTADKIIKFDWSKDLKQIDDDKPHSFGMVPITEYLNNSDGLGDYETELSLIDLYDSSQSDTANYMQDLSDAILAIVGRISFPEDCDTAEKQIEFMRKMRKARLLNLEPPVDADGREGHVDAKYLYKQYDVSGTEAYKKRVVDDIHKFTMFPDMSDENFGGNQSGVALAWKTFALDQARVDMQALFEKSLRRRYKLIAAIGTVAKELTNFDITKLSFTFTPNLPTNATDIINNAKNLYGMVSDETVLGTLEAVTGVTKEIEMERIESAEESASKLARQIEQNQRFSDKDLGQEVITDDDRAE